MPLNINEVVRLAFHKACKYLRDHPPCDAGWDGDMSIIRLLVDAEGDPNGERWANYFVKQVLDEMEWPCPPRKGVE